MAVKTSWSSGDVLTAADLTDTFAAKMDSIASSSASVATYQSTSSTTFTDLATAGPAVTLTTGTKALVVVTARMSNGSTGYNSLMGFAVSGASTVSAADERTLRIWSNALGAFQVSAAFLLTGLTAGSNTFTAKYKAESPSTANFENRSISVIDLGS